MCSHCLFKSKIEKKRLRMMKNRESASNSRKKKKQYMINLESTVSTLANDNINLKDENKKLKALLKKLHGTK